MGFLILLGFIALAALSIWARNAFWKAANRKVIMRKSHARGQSAIKATTTFVVPGSSAADVVSTAVDTLGYPTTKRAVAGEMVLLDATESSANFSPPNKFPESWVSRLLVADKVDGAHCSYQVLRWTLNDGTALGSKDMGDGTFAFRPAEPVSREAMAAFLYRFMGKPVFTLPTASPFVDVAPGGTFYAETSWLAANGISTGTDLSDGTFAFRPTESVRREAMAAFLHRTSNLTG